MAARNDYNRETGKSKLEYFYIIVHRTLHTENIFCRTKNKKYAEKQFDCFKKQNPGKRLELLVEKVQKAYFKLLPDDPPVLRKWDRLERDKRIGI